MSLTLIPITEDAPPLTTPELSAGQLLSAREREAYHFREKIKRELTCAGPARSADRVEGFKVGWDSALAFLRSQGALK